MTVKIAGIILTGSLHFIRLNSQVNNNTTKPGTKPISKGIPIIIIYQPLEIPFYTILTYIFFKKVCIRYTNLVNIIPLSGRQHKKEPFWE